MDIQVKVANKEASVIGAPVIVCGNSDYNILFDFDVEWEAMTAKTARFIYKKDGGLEHIDVPFVGALVAVPVLSGIDEVHLGLYAGELHTTTPARILCKKSILCPDPEPQPEPDPDVYKQLLEAINSIEGELPQVSAAEEGRVLTVNEAGGWATRPPEKLKDQKSGKLLKFFYGSYEDWEAWTGDKTDVKHIPTGVAMREAIAAEVTKLLNGETVVAEADKAATADRATSAAKAESVNGVRLSYEGGIVKHLFEEKIQVTIGDYYKQAQWFVYLYTDAELNDGDTLTYWDEYGNEWTITVHINSDGDFFFGDYYGLYEQSGKTIEMTRTNGERPVSAAVTAEVLQSGRINPVGGAMPITSPGVYLVACTGPSGETVTTYRTDIITVYSLAADAKGVMMGASANATGSVQYTASSQSITAAAYSTIVFAVKLMSL